MSVPWSSGLEAFRTLITERGADWVGHNFVAADLIILERLGINIPLDRCQDTIIWFWLTNPNLAKAGGKSVEEDAGERRGRGFFNLGTMLSVYTDLSYYKSCRGEGCSGPCPTHDVFGYNGIDALGPVLALPGLRRQARLRGVDKLYPLHRDLAYVLAHMQDYGVRIDVPYVDKLNEEFLRERSEIEVQLPFNPKSPKAILEFFKGIKLEDAQEDTVRELVEDLGDEAPEELVMLLDYKELGNGVNRWFERQYRDKNGWMQGYLDPQGFVHPRLNFFTSSSRLACSSPNFQNVAKRRVSRKMCICGQAKEQHPAEGCKGFRGESLGKKIRKAIIAPEGWYIVRADLSNAENRYVLHRGGYTIDRDTDLHAWVRDMIGIGEDWEIAIKEGSARNAAKSVQHGNNILEGLQLKTPEQLRTPKILKEIEAGARWVEDWRFNGKVVTFTGVNLARRIYGTASLEARKNALDISRKYFERFPGVRAFQKAISRQIERDHAIRTPNGYVTPLYGTDDERMKIAQGISQQSPIAHITKLALLNCWARWKRDGLMRPVLQIHDELLCYAKNEVPPETACRWLQEDMEVSQDDVPELKGLLIPAEPSHGRSWSEQNKA